MAIARVPITAVVELLAERWRARCHCLDDYLRTTFGVPAPASIPARLHLSQMADGTICPEQIGHLFAALWLVDAGGVREVSLDFEWCTRWDTDESGLHYLMHAYSFVAEGEELLLSERYGPGLKHRSRGRLVSGLPLRVAWRTSWHTGPEHGKPPQAPHLTGRV